MILGEEKCYWVFGHKLGTHEDLGKLLPPASGVADIRYVVSRNEKPQAWDSHDVVYRSPLLGKDGGSELVIWRRSAQHRIYLDNVATYDLSPTSIICYPCDVSDEILTNTLLGDILSLWLEFKGIVALHASAVVIDGGTVGLLSHSGNGKSTLAAALVQTGYPLLTDDILAVVWRGETCVGYPAYPWMRLWPNEAAYFVGHFEGLRRVRPELSKRWVPVGTDGFGALCSSPQPLVCLYLPERRDAESGGNVIEISPISSRDAVIELVRYSFAAQILNVLGLRESRLDLFVRIVQAVPLRQLIYPSGFDHLSRVRDAILEDLASLRS